MRSIVPPGALLRALREAANPAILNRIVCKLDDQSINDSSNHALLDCIEIKFSLFAVGLLEPVRDGANSADLSRSHLNQRF